MRIVAVTACPTGVALTYMAATRLAAAAKRLGHSIKIETQGALGTENSLSRKDILKADVALLAADIAVAAPERFTATRLLRVSTGEAIEDPDGVLTRAVGLVPLPSNRSEL